MDLFPPDFCKNILPLDGELYYHPTYFSELADNYYETLLEEIAWKNDEIILLGKRIITKRKTAWYGEPNAIYKYSGVVHTPLQWTINLLNIKELVELHTGSVYNSCLLNLYHDGSEGMGWHSDNEKELEAGYSIASLSFGAERNFVFKHNHLNQKLDILLQNGSLLEMKGAIQQRWKHALPKTKRVNSPRINLTFRKIQIN